MTRATRMMAIGPLSNGSRNLPHFIANGHTFATPDRVCNSMMPTAAPGEITRIITGTVRPGALAFKRFPSKGGC